MKKIFLIILVFTGVCTKAQYFQHKYGTKNTSLFSGQNFNHGSDYGHILCGLQSNSQEIALTVCDERGGFSNAPFNFNNIYSISDPITGAPINILFPDVIDLDPIQNGYGVVAWTYNSIANTGGIIYMDVDNIGNAANVNEYNPTGASLIVEAATKAVRVNGDVYITGSVKDTGNGETKTFILKINVSGIIQWSKIYDFGSNFPYSTGYDIIESPYYANEMVVVGVAEWTNHGEEGFFLRVDANTGASVADVEFYGNSTSDEFFRSITLGSDGAQGFVVSGVSDAGGNEDFWVTKLDADGTAAQWSYLYDGSVGSTSDFCYDVMERHNPMSVMYEYFAVGTRNDAGLWDAMVIKLDALGNAFSNGEFVYGTAPNLESGSRIDQFEGTGFDGISIFGTQTDPNTNTSNMLLVKAYFNGVTACDDQYSDPIRSLGPTNSGDASITNTSGFVQSTLNVNQAVSKDIPICYAPTVAGGSNARIAPEEPKGDKASTFSPNPINQGSSYANVELEVTSPTKAQVSIYDVIGRNYYTQTFNLIKGLNNLQLNISEANMAQGLYTVKITGDNLNKNIMVLVK